MGHILKYIAVFCDSQRMPFRAWLRGPVVAAIGYQPYRALTARDRLSRCSSRFYQLRQVPDVPPRNHHAHTSRLARPPSCADGQRGGQSIDCYPTQLASSIWMATATERNHTRVKVWKPPDARVTPLGPPPP